MYKLAIIPNQHNFDWSCTNREFVMFVPNFGRKHLLAPTVKRFQTTVSQDKWMWLVVNDGREEDLSDLESYNLRWFNFEREPIERNGCMIRNFVIKRLQSKWLCSKDPEIICPIDIVSKIIDCENMVYRAVANIELNEQETQTVLDNPFTDLTKLSVLRQWSATKKTYQGFHHLFCTRTQTLKDMQGYEEDFRDGYGYEDVNLLERLMAGNIKLVIDNDLVTYHIHHPIIRKFHKTILSNEATYKRKVANLTIVANQGGEWGGGV